MRILFLSFCLWVLANFFVKKLPLILQMSELRRLWIGYFLTWMILVNIPSNVIHWSVSTFRGTAITRQSLAKLQVLLAVILFVPLSDIDEPISHMSQKAPASVDQSKVDTLISFGFQEEVARKALISTVFLMALCMCSVLLKLLRLLSWFKNLPRVETLKKQLTGFLAILMLHPHQTWIHRAVALQLLKLNYQMDQEVSCPSSHTWSIKVFTDARKLLSVYFFLLVYFVIIGVLIPHFIFFYLSL